MGFILQSLRSGKQVLAFKTSDEGYEEALGEISKIFLNGEDKSFILDQKSVLLDLYSIACDLIIKKIHSVTSCQFYQLIVFLHDQSIEAYEEIYNDEGDKFFTSDFDEQDYSLSRRILKFILDESVNIQMKIITEPNNEMLLREKYESHIDQLFSLAYLVYQIANHIAEIQMLPSSTFIEVLDDKIYISRKGDSEEKIRAVLEVMSKDQIKLAVDSGELLGLIEFKQKIEECLKVNYDKAGSSIALIHQGLNLGDLGLFGWESLPLTLSTFGFNYADCERYFKGLTLNRTNKLSLKEIPLKPKDIKRHFYRPILIWTIDGKEYAIVTKGKYTESIIQFPIDVIPWGKAPEEWLSVECFKNFVHRKEDEHDKWLDDYVENQLRAEGLIYERNIKRFKIEDQTYNLEIPNVGEIDFLIINKDLKVMFVADCKNLQGRYDMVTYYNDYKKFTEPKGYNSKLDGKIEWCKRNIEIIKQYFKLKGYNLDIDNYSILGLFILNTPTFYQCMDSPHKITTIHNLIKVVKEGLFPESLI